MNKISLNLLSMIHICLPFIQSKLHPLQHESAEKHGSGNYIYVYKTNCVVWFISINKYTGICMLLKHTEIRGQIQRGALGLNILTVSCLSNPGKTPCPPLTEISEEEKQRKRRIFLNLTTY